MASSTSRSDIDEERFYFGKITSDEANGILRAEGSEEGTFLIRESSSTPGNYVLSFIADGQPVHLFIQNYKDEGFFSLVVMGASPVCQGLDGLVSHYSQYPVETFNTILSHPCPGDPLPANARLHGSSSLLHRSTSQGNMFVVSELLKTGYRKIDVKDNGGQTALHIACMKGYKEIAEMLLQSTANVEVRDEEGVTPLHLASRYNRRDIVQLLVEVGKADIQARAAKTGSVALHEAAEHGSAECIRTLLGLGAPSCPRNSSLEIPHDLAKKMYHTECFKLLSNHRPRAAQYSLRDYHHGPLDRLVAQNLLLAAPQASSGHFLLRQSPRKLSANVLTLLCRGHIYNYEIANEGDIYFIDDGPYFTSLETLVDHYIRFMDGLPCCLAYPVPPCQPCLEDTASSTSPLLTTNSELRRDSTKQESPEFSHTSSRSRTPGRTTDHLHRTLFQPVQGSSHSPLKEGGTYEDDLPSSSELMPMLSMPSQEDLKTSPHNYRRQAAQQPDIVVTKSLNWTAHNLIDFNEPERSQSRVTEGKPNTHPKPRVPARDSLKLDLQSLTISSAESSNMSGSSPTMDGNRTDEIFGEIDITRLSVGECMGYGEFGSVLKGIWLSPSGDKIDVAVKTLHNDDKVNKKNFLKEAEVMMNLNHLYIVKLVGVCHGPPVAMVQELMAMGSLLDFLLEHEEEISVDFHLKLWAAQVAEGMMYLEQKHFVHCDLAARNILLSSMTLVKISDFGLSRALGVDKDYYTAKDGGKWPLKWYAPESIYYGTFTHSSDVWGYGVTLWEMYTFGDQPYGELPGKDVVELLEKNERLPKPEKCPRGVHELMLRCWSYKPKKRPAFRELATIFRTMPEYTNIKPYFK